jgi:diketogulonate reductase-like aldo/keto reductase
MASPLSICLGKDNNGADIEMPLFGAETWLYNDTQAYEAACHSFRSGYIMVEVEVDLANAKGVGRAIRDCGDGGRPDLFVISKVSGDYPTGTLWIHQQTLLHELQLDHVGLICC